MNGINFLIIAINAIFYLEYIHPRRRSAIGEREICGGDNTYSVALSIFFEWYYDIRLFVS